MKRTLPPIKEALRACRMRTSAGRLLPMGVGCAFLGERGGAISKEAIHEDSVLMEKCYEAGFRMFDTSSDYGPSELVVGEFLRRVGRDSIFLATKSPYRFEREGAPGAFEAFKRSFYESFERLGVDYIDLYQIHDTNNYAVCIREVIPFLQARREEGVIGYIGMGTRDLNAMELGVRSGGLESVLSYLEYSLLKTSAQRLIDTAHKHGAAFLNAAVLHYGVVKAENPLEFHDLWWDGKPFVGGALHVRQGADRMQKLLKDLGVPVVAAALQVSMIHSDIDMTLNGIRRAANLSSTLEALDREIYPEQWADIFRLRRELPFQDIQEIEA